MRLGFFGVLFSVACWSAPISADVTHCSNTNTTNLTNEQLFDLVKECDRSGAYAKEHVFCLIGDINFDATSAFAVSKNLKALVIDSGGGSFLAAVPLGKEVFARHMISIILDRCYSACANYVFLASEHKVLLPKAGVFWHGSPRMFFRHGWSSRWDDKRAFSPSHLALHDEFIEMFDAKDRKNIDSIMSAPPIQMTLENEVDGGFWHYTDSELCSKFGVRNIYRIKKKHRLKVYRRRQIEFSIPRINKL